MTKILIAAAILISIWTATAGAASPCVEGVVSSRNLQIQTSEFSQGCFVILTPVETAIAYRMYAISQRGVVQIFNEFNTNDPNINTSTGARSFFFFPRRAVPAAAILADGNVSVVTSSGAVLNFSSGSLATPSNGASTGSVLPSILSSPSDAIQSEESPVVVTTNMGGVEFTQTPASDTLILDTGFMMGDASFTQVNASSIFIDPSGTKCTVKNSEVFSYTDPPTLKSCSRRIPRFGLFSGEGVLNSSFLISRLGGQLICLWRLNGPFGPAQTVKWNDLIDGAPDLVEPGGSLIF